MGAFPPPPFEDWVEYCFTRGYDDFHGETDDPDEVLEELEERFICMDPTALAQHMMRLFKAPSFIADRYSDDQIGSATWFIFGCASSYFGTIRSSQIEPELQINCIRSITTLYTDLFDKVCGRRGSDPDTDLREVCRVDGAVYRIWDMDQLEGAVMFPRKGPHLVEPGRRVLETVLKRCRTSACLVSALHAISSIYCIHSGFGNKAMAERMRRMIDEFLNTREIPDWVREYAACAREGHVW